MIRINGCDLRKRYGALCVIRTVFIFYTNKSDRWIIKEKGLSNFLGKAINDNPFNKLIWLKKSSSCVTELEDFKFHSDIGFKTRDDSNSPHLKSNIFF